MVAESNNKAILAFTVVTIIFLPLSFFTSYFGMNLQGIIDTQRTERYFWGVCGTLTALIVSFTVIFGFKDCLYGWLWADREYGRRGR
jgi:Mg2+ and Co2+ transporter CorA